MFAPPNRRPPYRHFPNAEAAGIPPESLPRGRDMFESPAERLALHPVGREHLWLPLSHHVRETVLAADYSLEPDCAHRELTMSTPSRFPYRLLATVHRSESGSFFGVNSRVLYSTSLPGNVPDPLSLCRNCLRPVLRSLIFSQSQRPTGANHCQPSGSSHWVGGPAAL